MDLLKDKVNAAISKKLDINEDFVQVADYIAPIVSNIELNSQVEKRITRMLEEKELSIKKEYLEEFEKINSIVRNFDEIVHRLNTTCSRLYRNIEDVRIKSNKLINKSVELNEKRVELNQRCESIDNFLNECLLSEEEMKEIEKCEETGRLTDCFLAAIEHANESRDKCKYFIQNEKCIAAFEILERMHLIIERCLSIICSSIKRELTNISIDYSHQKSMISKSFKILQSNTTLFQFALEELIKSRSTNILNKFVDFLSTKNDCMDASARKIMDILAFIHEITEIEKNLLKSLLLSDEKADASQISIEEILNQILKSLCIPLKSHAEQVITNEKDIFLIDKIGNFLNFYVIKFRILINENNELSTTLEEMISTLRQIFMAALHYSVEQFSEKMIPSFDLLPVQSVRQCVSLFEKLNNFNLAISCEPFISTESFFKFLIDPIVQIIPTSSYQLKSDIDQAIFIINNLGIVRSSVIKYKNVDERLQILEDIIDCNVNVLVSTRVLEMLNQSNLGEIQKKIEEYDESNKSIEMSKVEGLKEQQITETLIMVAHFLHLKAESATNPAYLQKLLDNDKRKEVGHKIKNEFMEVYEYIIKHIENPANGYENVNFLTIESVENLLHV